MKALDAIRLLDTWKPLPNYRAEPRVDFLISLAIPEITLKRCGSRPRAIIPELPLRIGHLYEKIGIDKSYKVDFYAPLENGRNVFVEVKTDSASRRDSQDRYLLRAKEIGMSKVLEGILQIYEVTKYKNKYAYLLDQLCGARLIQVDSNGAPRVANIDTEIELMYIQPNEDPAGNAVGFIELSSIFAASGDEFLVAFGQLLAKWAKD